MFSQLISQFFAQFGTLFSSPGFQLGYRFLADTLPLWLPIGLGSLFMKAWLNYVQTDYIIKQGSVLLEIKLPMEVTRSPLGIEIFLTSLHQKGSPTYITTYWEGKIPPWFSLEIASIEGKIKFFVWCPVKFKNIVESQLYAHYPDIEIYEVPDYTAGVRHDPVNTPIWGTYFKLTEPDPLPIKTYIDYGLDKADTKEEFKTDPMTSVLEFMGSLRKGEQIWLQILIRAHKKWGILEGKLVTKPEWKDKALKMIEKIRKESVLPDNNKEVQIRFPNPTKGQQEKIAGIERSLDKFAFDCAIRGMYVATKESLDASRFTGLIGSFRQYSSNYMNGFKLGWFTDFDYPWQDFQRVRRNAAERGMLNAYKMRSFFHTPYRYWHAQPLILTTEELATIFHFPGQVAQTPTLSRITSKKAEAPANLPI